MHENHVVFGTGASDGADAWLTTRRIDGQFPNYRQLLPETFEVELTLPKSELADVVRRASVLALRNSPLRLRLGGGRADRLGADPGRRRDAGVDAGARTRARSS